MPQANIPSEDEVLSYFDKFSNWGKWGADDELGAPNYITPAKVKQAIATVQEGTRISMSRTVTFEPSLDAPTNLPVHFMVESGEGWASGSRWVKVKTARKMEKKGRDSKQNHWHVPSRLAIASGGAAVISSKSQLARTHRKRL